MKNSFLGLELFVCCLIVQGSTGLKNTGEAKEDGFKIETTDEANSTWLCPNTWIPYSSKTENFCLLLNRTTRSFQAALSQCKSLGGGLVTFSSSVKEAFIKSVAKAGEGGEYWVGLSKDRGYESLFQWHTRSGLVDADSETLPQQVKDYPSYKAQCVYVQSFGDDIEVDDCESDYFFICEHEVSCKSGWFGDRCERECHCVGEPCNPKSDLRPDGVSCKWGCERNWMGAACDTEKQDPEVKYFCINSPGRSGMSVHIRIYTKGVKYRAIYGLLANKTRGDWCELTTSSTIDKLNNLTTIDIIVNDANIKKMVAGECVGQRLKDNTITWTIVVKESEGILLEHDLQINITCDFNKADTLLRSDQYSIKGEPHHAHLKTFAPESIQDDVVLQVVNAYSGDAISEANIGSSVVLQLRYGLQKGSLLTGVFPYNCVAFSQDGKHVKRLLDENGCQVQNSPLQPFGRSGNNKIATPWFNLFAFEEEQSVTFQCLFYLCFASDCRVGCWTQSRLRRDTQDRKDEVQHTTTRTIRVLPSISAQKPSGDSQEFQPRSASTPTGYEIGPFVYLNPVTCTLFLLILLIFLCMYIAFLRTVRKSVYDIRKEIEVKRSRDKFLHCGCVQQNDRDYITQS